MKSWTLDDPPAASRPMPTQYQLEPNTQIYARIYGRWWCAVIVRQARRGGKIGRALVRFSLPSGTREKWLTADDMLLSARGV